jgi:hypothetical protein
MAAAPVSGQITVSGTAQQLSATAVGGSALLLKAPASNANAVYIGPSTVTTSTGFPLDPGEDFTIEHRSQNGLPKYETTAADLYVVGTASDKLGWIVLS